ncbi:MAG: hypothetical protein ICV54_01385 [Nostoc sp. C3-bin3]|nr:hypothetical protein [Nostoc sp. C3-bin3]
MYSEGCNASSITQAKRCIESRYQPELAVSSKQGDSQWILDYSHSRSTQPTTSPPQCW